MTDMTEEPDDAMIETGTDETEPDRGPRGGRVARA